MSRPHFDRLEIGCALLVTTVALLLIYGICRLASIYP
jgi:hypothetical protein